MTVEEQAAMYRAGVEDLKAGYMGKVDWSSRYADALEDHMALEDLFPVAEDEDMKKVLGDLLDKLMPEGMEGGVPIVHGSSDLHVFPTLISSADWFSPEVTVQGYAAADAEWSMEIFKRWATAKRLAAQRPLIHNGRKMKR